MRGDSLPPDAQAIIDVVLGLQTELQAALDEVVRLEREVAALKVQMQDQQEATTRRIVAITLRHVQEKQAMQERFDAALDQLADDEIAREA